MCSSYKREMIFCVPKAWAVRTVDITSSANVPPSATLFRLSLEGGKITCLRFVGEDEKTYCAYLLMNLFMPAPASVIHGRIDEIAKAKRQDRIYATVFFSNKLPVERKETGI